MKTLLKIIGVLVGLMILVAAVTALLTPWMDRWGATEEEIAAVFPGDELVPEPASFVNRAITINAAPEYIYPWIVQLDATKGGWYSYTWLESLIGCKMVNTDRIHSEWQNLQVGDLVRMCPDEPAPPPYTVAQIHPDQAIVMGHQEDGEWVDLYQFVILPQTDGSSRLILRTRTQMAGGFWTIFHPGFFIMERGLLRGVKARAEMLTQSGYEPPEMAAEPTAEVFNSVEPSATPSALQTITWAEFGRKFSLSYDSLLAPRVNAQTAPAIPMSEQIMFAESHPSFVQFRFNGYQGGRAYQLPILPPENMVAQVMVFQTADFPGYGDESSFGFVSQEQALKQLLEAGIQPEQCLRPYEGQIEPLPFLPWINYQQVFCSQPQVIEFNAGRGIRYLTFYSQGPNPVLDMEVFYTFQGLTADGQFYVAAFFPVATGIFPTEPPACPRCGEADYNPIEAWNAILTEQLLQLSALPEQDFTPSLDRLDDLIASIQISQ